MSHKKGKEIDVDKIDLDRLKDNTTDIPGLIKYAHSRGQVSFSPTNEGAIKTRAHKIMSEQIDIQMNNIMEQVQVLAKQIERLKIKQDVSEMVYQAKMNFEPLVGQTYYLYQTENEDVLSMISPEEWGEAKLENKKYKYKATVKLMADHTWEVTHSNF